MAYPDFVTPVFEHVDRVFELCQPAASSMLADGLDLATLKPAQWEGKTLTNLACQQNFLRTLDALSCLTSDESYRTRADDWIGNALPTLQDSESGLFYWGGHTSYDLSGDVPVLGNHEMKCVYPHYDYLFRVDRQAMSRFVEAMWHAHIWDWSTLLFNRHGEYEPWQRAWDADFAGGPVPIIDNLALSFINTGSDLILSGVMKHVRDGSDTALRWAQHLLSRYEQIRHPETGLAGYQFNHRDSCRVRESFNEPLGSRDDVNEVTVLTNNVIKVRYGRAAITFSNALESLGEKKGAALRELVIADLSALADHAYDDSEHCFYPLLGDGTRLSPANANEGVGYCPPNKLTKVPADGLMFLSYAQAYRVTGVDRFGEVAGSLAAGMGWRDLEAPDGYDGTATQPDPHGWVNLGQNDVCALLGLLEMHKATGASGILDSAVALARRLLERYVVDGLIVSHHRTGETNIDSALPLALLHLAAAADGSRASLPAFYPNNTYFDPKIVLRKRG